MQKKWWIILVVIIFISILCGLFVFKGNMTKTANLSSEKVEVVVERTETSKTFNNPHRLGLEDYWDYTSHALVDGTRYVNLATLNNVVEYQDFSLVNYTGFNLDFLRTYNSKDDEKSAFGYGWTFTGNQKLYINTGASESDIQYKDADGTIHVYTSNGNGTYQAPNGEYDTLTKIDDYTYTLENPDKIVTTFIVKESPTDTDKKIAAITKEQDRNGNSINYEYTNHQLTAIYTNFGEASGKKLTFLYKDGLIVKATYADQVATYTYKDGYLIETSIEQAELGENKTTFTYKQLETSENKKRYLTKIAESNSDEIRFTYTQHADLVTVNELLAAPKKTIQTNYVFDNVAKQITVTSSEGEETAYYLNDDFIVVEIIDEMNDHVTYTLDHHYNILEEKRETETGKKFIYTYTYNSKGSLLTEIDAYGKQNIYTYDDAQNVLTEQDASGAITTYTYDLLGNILQAVSPKGEKTTYTHNALGEIIQIKLSNGVVENYKTNYLMGTETVEIIDGDAKTIVITDLDGNFISSTD